MKLFTLWLVSTAVFWLWFALSLHDVGFGLYILSRDFHDGIMMLYAWTLGVEPASIPRHFAEAFAVDGLLILGLFGFRRRQELFAWTATTGKRTLSQLRQTEWTRAGPAHPGE